jgi:hypothetical protein
LGATGNTIGGTALGARNLISGNNNEGVLISDENTSGNVVLGNFIGTNDMGTGRLANDSDGVEVSFGATGNSIGGTALGARNLISGNNANGVLIFEEGTSGNVVAGNFIGTNDAGTAALPNGFNGVFIAFGATGNTIGGTVLGARNLISANTDGVLIRGMSTSGNVVAGNFIGSNAAGTGPLANSDDGVVIDGAATGNTIGGTTLGAGNTIAFNGSNGINVNGAGSLGNSLLGNRIFANTRLGINLGNGGVTANDPLDPDNGANRLQNFPVLTRAESGPLATVIEGALNSTPGRTFRLEFFHSPTGDSSGFGEGQTLLGSRDVSTGASGAVPFSTSFALSLAADTVITATATDLTTGDTSEFSASQAVVIESPTVTINQAASQADPTNGQPIVFTVVFSEPVTGFNGADLSFARSTVGGTLTPAVTESGPLNGTTYTVRVSGATGAGDVVASVLAGAAQDSAGNLSLAFTSTDNRVTFLVASVSGTVYVDTNANGVQDPGEPGLASAPVFADVDGDGEQDPGEPASRTDSQGNYTLEQLPLGTQTIVNPLPSASFVRIVPTGNSLPLALTEASPSQGGLAFGIHPISPVLPTFPTLRPAGINATSDVNILFVQSPTFPILPPGGVAPTSILNIQYVQSLYRQILGREADSSSSFWVGLLPDPVTTSASVYQQARQVVAQGIWQSFEHRGLQINSYYQTLLGRLPDFFGASYWFNLLFFGGVSEQEVVAGIAGSAEYQGQFASQPEFFDGLYADILGSLTGPVPVSYNAGLLDPLGEFLAGQSSNVELARDLVFSDQSLIRGINGLGLSYLGRLLDQDLPSLELSFALYRGTGKPLLLSTTLLSSDEYLARVGEGLV